MKECGNRICKGIGECLLREAIQNPVDAYDLKDQWKVYSSDCVQTAELQQEYEQKMAELQAGENSGSEQK